MLTNHDSLPFVPKEEQCNRSRTRMGSNRSTYRMNMDILNSILLPYQIRNHPRIFFTVSMADKNRLVLVLPASNPFIHHPYQFRQRFLSASDLGQKRIRCPSSSTWSIGLIPAIVPTIALSLETRPPRCRWNRSSTVNT